MRPTAFTSAAPSSAVANLADTFIVSTSRFTDSTVNSGAPQSGITSSETSRSCFSVQKVDSGFVSSIRCTPSSSSRYPYSPGGTIAASMRATCHGGSSDACSGSPGRYQSFQLPITASVASGREGRAQIVTVQLRFGAAVVHADSPTHTAR